MPIYSYQCSDCNGVFEVMHSMSEDCTACGYCLSPNVTRVVADVSNLVDSERFKTKPGDLVKSHIEDAKQSIKEQKQGMKKEF
jgi:putative FmdB family regulatory protein